MNYPVKKRKVEKFKNMANKGMDLEELVNETNSYYLDNDIAVIHKKPTPVQIVHVSYPSRKKAMITEAYYKTPSTTDYNGVYKGYYIDFDCKECQSLTSFPIKNVHIHQIIHLKKVNEQKGIAFLLIYFIKYDEYYLVPIEKFIPYYNNSLNDGRKSIPYSEFEKIGIKFYESYKPRLDYLKAVDIYLKETN